jgi:hypothetical protein
MHAASYRSFLQPILFAALLSACGGGSESGALETGEPSVHEDIGEGSSELISRSSAGGPAGGGGYSVGADCALHWNGDTGKVKQECYTDWRWRDAYPVSQCPGKEQDGALCYPWCSAGFTGVGPVCWQDCPAGYADLGASCYRAGNIIPSNNSMCPWYDVCGVALAKGCSSCPPGYANDGCTCRIDPDSFYKISYGRGVGEPMSCAPGLEPIGALCYGSCPSGYVASGVYCNATQQTCMTVPITEPAPPLSDYCFALKNPDSTVEPCSAWLVRADTQQHATTLAQCKCTNCTVVSVSCDAYHHGTACQ